LPIQAFAGKMQIPALADFNAGICRFGTGVFSQLFSINIPEMFVGCQDFVGD